MQGDHGHVQSDVYKYGGKCHMQVCRGLPEDGGIRNAAKRLTVSNNECEEVPGTCSQTCINTVRNVTCKCVEGYQKIGDGKHCKKIAINLKVI